MLAWVYLSGAIVLEIIGTMALKFSNGFADWRFAMLALTFYAACFWMLSLSLRVIPVSTAYAVWAGAGVAAVAMIGSLFFKEPMSPLKCVLILMIIVGVAGLNAVGHNQ